MPTDALALGPRTSSSRQRTSLAEWRAAGHWWQHRGHRIFYRTAGARDAEPLLLIHGFPTASWDWEALWQPLAARWRLVAPDLIGFGFSDKPAPYPYAIADQAELCEGLLRHEKVTTCHVLAHDYGDTVAQELLARQGEPGERARLLSVALLNGGLFPETHRALAIQKLLLSPLGPVIARAMSRRSLAKNMRRVFGAATPPDDELLDAFWQLLAQHDGRRVVPLLLRYIIERRQHRERWVDALQRARIPLKLIDGSADPISGRHMADRYRALVPRPDITLLEGIGHYPQCEAPEAVLQAYLAFRQ
jgi:pimeloyl-ACP methyl ester carboxylesterase